VTMRIPIFESFQNVVDLITGNYVEKVDVDKVMGGAMHGLADSLDRTARFSRLSGEADRGQRPAAHPETLGSISRGPVLPPG